MKKAFNFLFVTTKAGFFLLAALLWSGVMFFANYYHGISWKEIFVEADGMVFDLIVFGVVLTIYEAYRESKEKRERTEREKNEKIERLHEEIDDYREWPEKEAKFRIMGAVRRLFKEGEKKLNLRNCYLEGANFANNDLSGTHFDGAILADAKFYGTVLIQSTFQAAKLKDTTYYGANLTGADFSNSDLCNTKFSKDTNLSNAKFEGSVVLEKLLFYLEESNKGYPYKSDAWFRKLEKDGVVGWEEIENKYYVDEFGILRLK